MEEFLLIFRGAVSSPENHPSPEQLQVRMKFWQDWMQGLVAQKKLVSNGNTLDSKGLVVKPNNVVINGPYVEAKEAIGGYIIIRAESLAEAAKLSKGCPILTTGGSVEVRMLISMEDDF